MKLRKIYLGLFISLGVFAAVLWNLAERGMNFGVWTRIAEYLSIFPIILLSMINLNYPVLSSIIILIYFGGLFLFFSKLYNTLAEKKNIFLG